MSPEVAGVDFFRHGGLPVPQVTIADAERIAASFGLTVRAQPLGSQQDSNFLLAEPGGAVAGVLKVANPAFSAAEIEAQDGAAAHIAGACEDLRVATATHGPVAVPVDGGAAEVMTALILAELGLGPGGPLRVPSGRVLDLGRYAVLDLSAQSDAVDEGSWLEPGLEDRLAGAMLADGYDAVVTRFGEARLTASTVLAGVSPATVATGIDLWTAVPVELPAQLTVSGDGTRRHVSLRAAGAPEVPALVRPEYAAGWLSLVADPGPLLGLPAASRSVEGNLLERRDASFAAVQEHYYRDPPRIERGWRQHLAATDGRVYLDMVNNVSVLGHAHPRVEAAVARQLRRLNTNSRFNYASVVEFSERLAGLLPAPLEVVFLVNSGSEAVDLALRLALVATGHQDVVAVRAVHGSGLYLGVEFVRDRGTLEPATEETMAICDRMLELGVVIQPTSDRMCVLKIKPPLCLDVAGADYFADALDRVLTEGW